MIYSFVAVLLFLSALAYFRIAKRFNIVDVPNHRSAHKNVTIRGIGIIFLISTVFYFVYSDFNYPYFFIGLMLIGVVSFVDDVKPLPNRYRLLAQFLAIALLVFQVFHNIAAWPLYLLFPLPILLVGIINAYNFMDGINGITGAYSLLTIGTLYYITANEIPFIDQNFLLFTGIGIGVFLFFNFRKVAVGFCGDVGSVSVAFIIVFCLLLLIVESGDPKYIFLLTMYGVDTIYTLIYRLRKGENIFEAHNLHFFQLLVHQYKWSHLQVSGLYVAVQLVLNAWIVAFGLSDWLFYVPTLFVAATVHYFRSRKSVAI